MGHRVLRLHRNDPAKLRLGLIETHVLYMTESDVQHYRTRERIKLVSLSNRRHCFLVATRRGQKLRMPFMSGRVIRIDLDGAPECCFGTGKIPFTKFLPSRRCLGFDNAIVDRERSFDGLLLLCTDSRPFPFAEKAVAFENAPSRGQPAVSPGEFWIERDRPLE